MGGASGGEAGGRTFPRRQPATPSMRDNPIVPTIDLAADGVQHGFLRLPYSRDDSAWGSVMIPLAVIRNGSGPTALFAGANHGDEYEGPLALQELALELDPSNVRGRVIIVPFMNYPAFRAGSRTSPIDRGNLNRTFPGRPDGTVTEKIADYFTRTLLPQSDLVLDFHSGGRTLDFVPFASIHHLPDAALQARARVLPPNQKARRSPPRRHRQASGRHGVTAAGCRIRRGTQLLEYGDANHRRKQQRSLHRAIARIFT